VMEDSVREGEVDVWWIQCHFHKPNKVPRMREAEHGGER
jgi:hypothetical protein